LLLTLLPKSLKSVKKKFNGPQIGRRADRSRGAAGARNVIERSGAGAETVRIAERTLEVQGGSRKQVIVIAECDGPDIVSIIGELADEIFRGTDHADLSS
jgi:hypothetical protein